MVSFIEDLWSSIFTPGPTPTLLVATNVTFAALQTLLFALLLATRSIHFFVLSFLSGSLWYSINWFAREVKQLQTQAPGQQTQAEEALTQTEEKKEATTESDTKPWEPREARETPDPADSATETESLAERRSTRAPSPLPPPSATGSTTLHVPGGDGEVRKRLSVGGESSGYTSTDSEWEKVDESNAT